MRRFDRTILHCVRAALLSCLCASAVLANSSNDWWSLQPLRRAVPPEVKNERAANPIDLFLLERLGSAGLDFSPEASRQTLIRRVYFDLIGLPPSPEEARVFVNDTDPQSYERLIDRLLSLPQYGERWARHWLDVVHYGDTHGYDKDQPRPNAWPYRDYVIRAFNEDRPYSRFVQEQIAGDVLFPYTRDGIEALGFIAAGPWDLIGHAEVPETKTDGKIARHLDRDDMVANTMNTFNSLTVQCAQCHNHKFDPIPTEDYYRLQAVFAAVDRTNREYYDKPEWNEKHAELKDRERSLLGERRSLESKIAAEAPELAAVRERIRRPAVAGNQRPAEHGYHSAIENRADAEKWVQIDLGCEVALDQILLRPASDDFGGIGDGFGFPRRFRVEIATGSGYQTVDDRTAADVPNPGAKPYRVTLSGKKARHIRLTATQLAPRQGDFIFALAELEALNDKGENLARGVTVAALDSIENPIRWGKANLVDGIYHGNSGDAPDVATLEKQAAELFETKLSPSRREAWRATTNHLSEVQRELSLMPKPMVAFVGGIHQGSGTFVGTGPSGGQPRPIAILARGDVRKPLKEVKPGALSALDGLPSDFEIADDAPEGERRKALALWLTHRENPLTWRSIVNRVWQYHFGRGLVATPNDFGRMGEKPSHPELLDWLAVEFRDGGQSLKALHKLILMSAAYRQVSTVTAETSRSAEIDSENRLLWRVNRRKLEAEALRDAVLLVSGQLDSRMFGPGFQDFVVEKPEHSPHYMYDKFNPDDSSACRRSIYRFIVRSQQQPFMTALDCADPSMLVARRNESVSALQALALMNNSFMLANAQDFAHNLQKTEPSIEAQVQRGFARALSRPPTEKELRDLTAFTAKNGLANTCRLLFNLNEFAFVD